MLVSNSGATASSSSYNTSCTNALSARLLASRNHSHFAESNLTCSRRNSCSLWTGLLFLSSFFSFSRFSSSTRYSRSRRLALSEANFLSSYHHPTSTIPKQYTIPIHTTRGSTADHKKHKSNRLLGTSAMVNCGGGG